MTIGALLASLGEAADALGIVAPDVGTKKGKAYEAWMMLELAVRLQQDGVWVTPLDHLGNPAVRFRIADGPSLMPSAMSSTGKEPCHFLLRSYGADLELHLGLRHQGVSSATHEIDISIVRSDQARSLRAAGGGPFEGSGEIGLELKAFDERHKLPLHVARTLVGIAVDLDPSWVMTAFTIGTAGGSQRSFSRIDRSYFALVTTTGLYDNSRRLLEHHGAGAHERTQPGNAQALDALCDIIRRALS